MTQKDKELLLKDLCARLPYGVKCTTKSSWNGIYTIEGYKDNRVFLDCSVYDEGDDEWMIESIVPYLRPMSNMTDEEKEEYDSIQCDFGIVRVDRVDEIFEFLLSHHFDFVRTNDGLTMIEAGLALEAPKGMYNIKEK